MNGMKTTFSVMVFILILITGYSLLFGQKTDTQQFLSNLKAGEWVKIEGMIQKDSTILLEKVKAIYGEVEDDDWEIDGIVSRVAADEKRVYILRLPIQFDKNTEFKHKNDDDGITSFADIQPGIFVEIEGSFLKDSTFLANEIGSEKVKSDEINIIEWKGKVQSVDPANNSFTILGHRVFLTPETKIKSLIHD